MFNIRPATPEDAEAFYKISLVTGDGGGDATYLHKYGNLIGDYYSVPYLHGARAHAFVAEDQNGVAGFAVGAADTIAFEHWMKTTWGPAARLKYPAPDAPEITPDDARYLLRIHHGDPDPPDVVKAYPAHMHMNLSLIHI